MPRYDYPEAEAQQGPAATQFPVPPTGIPASFGGNQQPAAKSPSDEDAFWTPPQRPIGLARALEAQTSSVRLMHSSTHSAQDGRFITQQLTRIPHRGTQLQREKEFSEVRCNDRQ